MKLKFKHQAYQSEAVQAVIDCFKGQPNVQGIRYRLDPGAKVQLELTTAGFRNSDIALNEIRILENIQGVQKHQNLSVSPEVFQTSISSVNLDVEMETGTGKTYCYIKTIFYFLKKGSTAFFFPYLEEDDLEMLDEIRFKMLRGLVVGSECFIEKMEGRLGRSLACLRPGRSKKEVDPFSPGLKMTVLRSMLNKYLNSCPRIRM